MTAAWHRIHVWLAGHAPESYGSLMPPAAPEEIQEAEDQLRLHIGHGFPDEVVCLWQLCGGASAGRADFMQPRPDCFLPGGALLTPREAADLRLALHSSDLTPDAWGRSWVPWQAENQEGAEAGLYADAEAADPAVGDWSIHSGPEISAPDFASLSACLEAVADALESGTGPLMRSRGVVPGTVAGCLVWSDPDDPDADEWKPVHRST